VAVKLRMVLRVAVLFMLVSIATAATAAATFASPATVASPTAKGAAVAEGWQKQAVPSSHDGLLGVSFVDVTHGWAVGQNDQTGAGVAVATGDGVHWAEQTLPAGTGALYAVKFVDATHGWAVGAGCVLVTADGGVTWAAQAWPTNLDATTTQLKGVDFVDAYHGGAVGRRTKTEAAVIIATVDGGTTWTTQTAPTGVATLYDVEFVDALHGWAVGSGTAASGPSAGVLLATTDGGATWTPQSVPTGRVDPLYSASAGDTAHCWIGGTRMVLATVDAGLSWTQQGDGLAGTQRGIGFADTTHGWAVGPDGIIATVDGGTTWRRQSQPLTSGVLNDVAAVDATHAWSVGYDGTILATGNGGFVSTPAVTRLSPTSGRRGATVTITGTGFQPSRGTGYVKFGATKATKYLTWTAAKITCKVPAKAKYGRLKVVIVTAGGTSAAKKFTVKR
jgi:photosystem II stability/assembly factor-like uncharacterized protein